MTRRYKTGVDRQQGVLLPPSVEEYVSADNPVRAIDAYVESLDLQALGFTNTAGGVSAGQPAYHPGTLLKLYLYGYLMRVRSSRRLEQECRRNLELIWLVQGLRPNNKTIATFRKDNARALKATNREFVLLCRELELYGQELVAIDGAFFRGNAGKQGIYTRGRLNKALARLERHIEGYLSALEQADAADERTPSTPSAEALQDKLQALRTRQAQYAEKLERLEHSGEGQLSEVDPDARLLRKSGQRVSGYNVQIAVDSKHKLLAACAATNEGNDTGQLAPMACQAKAALGVERLEAVADAGYWNDVHFKRCEEAGITPYVPEPAPRGRSAGAGRLARSAFRFDAQANVYRCPAGRELTRRRTLERGDKRLFGYASARADCAGCRLRGQCLPHKAAFRELYRWEHEAVLEAHRERMAAHGAHYLRARAALAEHPFGTLKRWSGWDHFLVRGRQKVSGELNLLMLCYNFRRMLNIVGLEGFRAYLAARAQARADSAEGAYSPARTARISDFWRRTRKYRESVQNALRILSATVSTRPHVLAR